LTEEQLAELAQDVHVRVADHPLVLPRIAVGNQYAGGQQLFPGDGVGRSVSAELARQRLRDASAPAAALDVPQLRILIKHYGWEEDIPQSQAFCRQLRRRWSRALCNNAAPALIQALPSNDSACWHGRLRQRRAQASGMRTACLPGSHCRIYRAMVRQ
jgi:hypothetical protein